MEGVWTLRCLWQLNLGTLCECLPIATCYYYPIFIEHQLCAHYSTKNKSMVTPPAPRDAGSQSRLPLRQANQSFQGCRSPFPSILKRASFKERKQRANPIAEPGPIQVNGSFFTPHKYNATLMDPTTASRDSRIFRVTYSCLSLQQCGPTSNSCCNMNS